MSGCVSFPNLRYFESDMFPFAKCLRSALSRRLRESSSQSAFQRLPFTRTMQRTEKKATQDVAITLAAQVMNEDFGSAYAAATCLRCVTMAPYWQVRKEEEATVASLAKLNRVSVQEVQLNFDAIRWVPPTSQSAPAAVPSTSSSNPPPPSSSAALLPAPPRIVKVKTGELALTGPVTGTAMRALINEFTQVKHAAAEAAVQRRQRRQEKAATAVRKEASARKKQISARLTTLRATKKGITTQITSLRKAVKGMVKAKKGHDEESEDLAAQEGLLESLNAEVNTLTEERAGIDAQLETLKNEDDRDEDGVEEEGGAAMDVVDGGAESSDSEGE